MVPFQPSCLLPLFICTCPCHPHATFSSSVHTRVRLESPSSSQSSSSFVCCVLLLKGGHQAIYFHLISSQQQSQVQFCSAPITSLSSLARSSVQSRYQTMQIPNPISLFLLALGDAAAADDHSHVLHHLVPSRHPMTYMYIPFTTDYDQEMFLEGVTK